MRRSRERPCTWPDVHVGQPHRWRHPEPDAAEPVAYRRISRHGPDEQHRHQRDEAEGRHTIKAGYQLDHSLKKQEQLGNPKLFQGRLNFGNDTNNPIEPGLALRTRRWESLRPTSRSTRCSREISSTTATRQYPGQLEGEQPAVSRLRSTNHESGTELRHEAAGVKLFRVTNGAPRRRHSCIGQDARLRPVRVRRRIA